jgi:hypothetical protein
MDEHIKENMSVGRWSSVFEALLLSHNFLNALLNRF